MEYRAITGRIFGTVRYENEIAALGGRVETELTLLTLDVASNRENRRTDVGLNFYTADERYVDAGTSFVLTLQSMGIVETREFLINLFQWRDFTYSLYRDGNPVVTSFKP